MQLSLRLGKHKRLVLKQAPEHADEVNQFCTHLGLEYRGQSLATVVELALQKLLKQKRRQPTQEERRSVYRRQEGKCKHCAGELDIENEENEELKMCRDSVAGQQVRWRALCKPCHALLTDREATRKNPLLSSFNAALLLQCARLRELLHLTQARAHDLQSERYRPARAPALPGHQAVPRKHFQVLASSNGSARAPRTSWCRPRWTMSVR